MSVIWSWTYFYNLHWNNYLYFKGLLYIWEERFMMALLYMASLENSECIWKIQRKPEVAVSGEKGRYLPWSKEEEGVYIFWMKQGPVVHFYWYCCCSISSVFCVFVVFLSTIKYLSFCYVIPVYLYHILLLKLYVDPLRLINNKDNSQSVIVNNRCFSNRKLDYLIFPKNPLL